MHMRSPSFDVQALFRVAIGVVARIRRARLLGLVLFLGCAGSASAQYCSASEFGIPFGNVTPAGATVITSVPLTCQKIVNAPVVYFKACLMIAGGTGDLAGVNPRKLSGNNRRYLDYNLYSDPAFQAIIGPPPDGGGYPLYSVDIVLTAPQDTRQILIYAKLPPFPASTPATTYQAINLESSTVIRYAYSTVAPPTDCFQNPGRTVTGIGYRGARATVTNACSIRIASAQDLVFPTVAALDRAQMGESTISLTCPSNTAWRLGLSNGNHFDGTRRRMSNGLAGQYVNYELYLDRPRSQRWGNDLAGGSDTANGPSSEPTAPTHLTVYGLVPAQPSALPGTYSDTVIVNLQY